MLAYRYRPRGAAGQRPYRLLRCRQKSRSIHLSNSVITVALPAFMMNPRPGSGVPLIVNLAGAGLAPVKVPVKPRLTAAPVATGPFQLAESYARHSRRSMKRADSAAWCARRRRLLAFG